MYGLYYGVDRVRCILSHSFGVGMECTLLNYVAGMLLFHYAPMYLNEFVY